ncbi:MAG: 30S ribosomal protein S4e [Candidatus Aenigmarchaeota archaeon]|nr:30S ribosomal protein S4e [Candidatus Aenigmarchaeota archaeon]
MVRLKRLSAPKFWKVSKKRTKWVVSPRPGPHKKFESIPLVIIIRDLLKLADTSRDAKKIIKTKNVLVDGKPRKDLRYPVGLFDLIDIPKEGKMYRVVPDKHGLILIEAPKKESNLKICRIKNKTMVKGGNIQLNLYDGKNIVIKDKKEDYSTGDSVLIELPSQKIVEHIKMEKGAVAIITGGQNIGDIINIKDIITTKSREPNKVVCKKEDREFEAIMDYVYVVGKEKPLIKLTEK